MKKRPIIALVAVALLAFVVAACGDDDDAATTTAAPTTTTTEAVTTTTAPPTTTTTIMTTLTTMGDTTTTTEGASDTTMGDADAQIDILVQGDRFSEDQIILTAGEPTLIVVTDRDTETDEPHNFHIRTPEEDYFTEIQPAPNVQELVVQINVPGTYEFFCDTHAQTMTGTVVVEEDM